MQGQTWTAWLERAAGSWQDSIGHVAPELGAKLVEA